VLWNKTLERRGHIYFMALTAIILLFMTLDFSLPFWEQLPLIRFVQFPWRFVGRAALPIAILAGAFILFRAFQTWKKSEPDHAAQEMVVESPTGETTEDYVARLEDELRRR